MRWRARSSGHRTSDQPVDEVLHHLGIRGRRRVLKTSQGFLAPSLGRVRALRFERVRGPGLRMLSVEIAPVRLGATNDYLILCGPSAKSLQSTSAPLHFVTVCKRAKWMGHKDPSSWSDQKRFRAYQHGATVERDPTLGAEDFVPDFLFQRQRWLRTSEPSITNPNRFDLEV